MRLANLAGRAVLLTEGGAADVAKASDGAFGPSPRDVLDDWDAFRAWAADASLVATPFDPVELGAPVPDPRQVFGIGLNYRDHADEANLAHPEHLVVFTKFVSSLAGPHTTVVLPGDRVDWETELVVVVGRQLHHASSAEALEAVAGYAVGQDLSERAVQTRGPAPQFSLGKSFPGFAPYGPAVVTADELANPSALRVRAVLEGPSAASHDGAWTVQDGTTADLIFPVGRILADLSQVVTLYPGDLVFTGTPAGVGMARGVFLQAGDVLTSTIEGVGTITNRFVAS